MGSVICAWCKKELKYDRGKDVITHGICEECSKHIFFQMGVSVQEYIDDIKAPVCIVGGDVDFITANKAAQTLLDKDVTAMHGEKGGDVFECENARLPGGCGHTVCCSGCVIRNTVMDTFKTGKKHEREPAALHASKNGETVQISMHISTEKVGDVVYLRIDKID